MHSWLMATSDMVMQGWGAVRDFATVKDALFSWSPKNTPIQRERSPMLFLLFGLREIKLVGTCAEVQTVRKAQALFQGRGRYQRACSPPYSSQVADAITSTGHLGRVDLVSVQV